jgi:hypothetical protein
MASITWGHPKVYISDYGGSSADEDWIYLRQDLDFVVAVSASSVQVWSAGLQRVRLSQVIHSEDDLAAEGANACAYWCSNKLSLAVLVRISMGPGRGQACCLSNAELVGCCMQRSSFSTAPLIPACMQTTEQIIHVYSIYQWPDTLLLGSSMLAKDVPKVDLYLKMSIRLDLDSRARVISGDSRFILVGCEDGSVAALAWSGKVRRVFTHMHACMHAWRARGQKENCGLPPSSTHAFILRRCGRFQR